MDPSDWQPVESYWCIVLQNGLSIEVSELEARHAIASRTVDAAQDLLDLRDIYGSRYIIAAGDVSFVHENTPAQRDRVRRQEKFHEDESDDDTEDAWKS